jgi:hypothetical protein
MSRNIVLGALACAVIVRALGASSAAAAVSLLVPQSTAFSFLGHSCGGIQEQSSATGFDPSTGDPTDNVYISTRCGGSGRGGGYHVTTYAAWVAVTWDLAGGVVSAATVSPRAGGRPGLLGDRGERRHRLEQRRPPVPDRPGVGRADGRHRDPGRRPAPGLADPEAQPGRDRAVDDHRDAGRIDRARPHGDRDRLGSDRTVGPLEPATTYQIRGSDGCGTFTQTIDGSTLSAFFSVSDVPDWSVTVRAHDAAGWGPWSARYALGGDRRPWVRGHDRPRTPHGRLSRARRARRW